MGMAQPHKGPRRQVISRMPEAVYALIAAAARESGVSSPSQYIADVMAEHVGRADLARELGLRAEGLPLAM